MSYVPGLNILFLADTWMSYAAKDRVCCLLYTVVQYEVHLEPYPRALHQIFFLSSFGLQQQQCLVLIVFCIILRSTTMSLNVVKCSDDFAMMFKPESAYIFATDYDSMCVYMSMCTL